MISVKVAYSIHRPEIVPLTREPLSRATLVCLEEPETPGFGEMLAGALSVEDYLLATEYEYPAFSLAMCGLLKEAYASGARIVQVEPYLDVLTAIHERFAEGGRPADIPSGSLEERVYKTEKVWYGALLDYYKKAADESFAAMVQAVTFFGKADAARGRLRDTLRAQAVARLVEELAGARTDDSENAEVFVETGYIHVFMLPALRKALTPLIETGEVRVEPLYLLEPVVRQLTGRRMDLEPGDALTIRYIYNPEYEGEEAKLQAARSILRQMVLTNDEMEEPVASFPHTRDEIHASDLVRALDYAECAALYPELKGLSRPKARAAVTEYLLQRDGAVPEYPEFPAN